MSISLRISISLSLSISMIISMIIPSGGATGTHDTTEYNGPVGLLKKEPGVPEKGQHLISRVLTRGKYM